jgi:hypothetical protein
VQSSISSLPEQSAVTACRHSAPDSIGIFSIGRKSARLFFSADASGPRPAAATRVQRAALGLRLEFVSALSPTSLRSGEAAADVCAVTHTDSAVSRSRVAAVETTCGRSRLRRPSLVKALRHARAADTRVRAAEQRVAQPGDVRDDGRNVAERTGLARLILTVLFSPVCIS